MLTKNSLIILIVIALALVSCSKRLSPEEYMQYMLRNRKKYSQTIERNGVKATVCYQPVEMCAARELAFYNSLCKDSVLKNYDNCKLLHPFTLLKKLQISSEELLPRG